MATFAPPFTAGWAMCHHERLHASPNSIQHSDQTTRTMPSEFDLIHRHFSRPTQHTDLAGGDDAALMSPGEGMQLVVSTDMLVADAHFFADTAPRALGWKTLAVNISDIAAMGAQPRWAVLSMALPDTDETWLAAFADGLYECADAFGVDLVGGDTTRGPLNLCVTLFGEAPAGTAVTRAGALPGDDIWVTGQPGRAALGLAHLNGEGSLSDAGARECLEALHQPQPRVAAGLALRDIASAMLDVSDGVLGDLRHILERSEIGAEVALEALPLNALYTMNAGEEQALQACLSGGDDYELLFTAPRVRRDQIMQLADSLNLPMHRIGRINDRTGKLHLLTAEGDLQTPAAFGYDHFG